MIIKKLPHPVETWGAGAMSTGSMAAPAITPSEVYGARQQEQDYAIRP